MEVNYNPRYTKKHLSIRVPWHDNAWDGTICKNVKNNDACLILKNCAENRDDDLEEVLAGKRICDIKDENQLPPCISESAMFMSEFDFTKRLKHPYANGWNQYYKHLQPTPVVFPKYSASAIPFRWGMPDNAEIFAEQYDLDYNSDEEPYIKTGDERLKFTTNWVQNYHNQKTLFDCFFEHINPMESLSFFYAKEVPFVEENNRVLIGIGEITSIIQSKPFNTSDDTGFVSMPWEHMVNHSIRPDFKNGFIFPYHEAIEYQKEHPGFDPKSIAVIIPNEFRVEFSYASEHVSHDFAIYILRESIKKVELAKRLGIGSNWDHILEWLSKRLILIKELRGDYPGFGVALTALGIERGNFLAQHIFNNIKKHECPWEYLDVVFNDLDLLPDNLRDSIPVENIEMWNYYKNDQNNRLSLLQLLSRFNLNETQVEIIFDPQKRKKEYQDTDDDSIVKNPYLLYEISIHSTEPINFSVIDTGLMLNKNKKLKPNQTKQFSTLSKERIKALTIMQLEKQANNGHTLYPEEELIKNIADLSIEPECNLNADYFNLAASVFDNSIITHYTIDNKKAYQLSRFNETAELINTVITKRLNGKRHNLKEDWEIYLSDIEFKDTDADRRAKEEKIKALEEMSNARFSVLIGQAGSGKTTLLSALASIPDIKRGNVLFLAPTGKARVKMEEKAKKYGVTAKTIASFLFRSGRFKGSTQSYHLNDAVKEMGYRTVIIDECSMLTEEMLAATLQHLRGVERLILVGDYRQLPPIGAGRPFFDIINYIKPEGIENKFPKISNSYIELTTSARQVKTDNKRRLDTDFANLFGGNIPENNADEIFDEVINGKNENIKIYSWDNESDFEELLFEVLETELGIKDEQTFNKSIGANEAGYFNWNEAVNKVEDWQLLSPVRSKVFGTNQLNRGLHQNFKKDALYWAYNGRKTPKPLGREEIVYGDKVINLQNHKMEKGTYPDDGINYLANGEIGITVGRTNWKNGRYGKQPYQLEVEFSSQKGFKYQFTSNDFDEENGSYLELAYSLTVHKAQGSQFKTVLLVIPEPCVLLSRELLYTALTRQENNVIVLYQGNPQMLFNYTNDYYSANLQRITNLFYKPNITKYKEILFEKNLIHCASDGKFLRSKSEVIIYELLLNSGLEPVYEYELEIDGEIKRPDFYIVDDDSGEKYYWEHLGMLNDIDYAQKWKLKLDWYKSKNILPNGGENGTLIITKDDPKGGISAKEIVKKIEEVFKVKSNENTLKDLKKLTTVVFQLRDSVESYFSEFTIQFNELKKSTLEVDETIENIYKVLDENTRSNNLQAYYSNVINEVENYDILKDNSKMFLASAYFLKDKFDKSNIDDYSPYILQFSRALENELLHKYFISFFDSLDRILESNPNFLKDEFSNDRTKIFASLLNKRSYKFTMGTMVFILGLILDSDGKTISSSNLLQEFRKHIVCKTDNQFLTSELIENLIMLTADYRNKAAHINQINKEEANVFHKLGLNVLEQILSPINTVEQYIEIE